MAPKTNENELAIFGGNPLFENVKSTSNLVKPNLKIFDSYLKKIYSTDSDFLCESVIEVFEERFAQNHGTKYCVSFCNGFWSIVLTMKCLALEGKTEVIMPSFTYRRMADIAAWLNLTPHFCDISKKTKGITADAVESCINDKTALIMGVHPIVNLCDIDGLVALSKKANIPILFDSVEAAYASHNGQLVGGFGEAECFSMHASKFLNGFEAGYVTTNNLSLAKRLRTMKNGGIATSGEAVDFGIDGNLNEVHASLALASLDDLDNQIIRNQKRYNAYKKVLAAIPGLCLWEYSSTETRTFKNIIVTLNSDWPFTTTETLDILHRENMLARPYYSPPLHLNKTPYATIIGDLTNTEQLMNKSILLPCGEFVSIIDIELIGQLLGSLQKMNRGVFQNLSEKVEV